MSEARTAEILDEILRELDRPSGPTEGDRIDVIRAWSEQDQVFIVYSAPWWEGPLGYSQHLTGWDEAELAQGIAHFTIAEPLGRISLLLGPPDPDGVTWWDAETSRGLAKLIFKPDGSLFDSG